MAGYNGFSMSNNAVEAYFSGEMPWSKWSKRELLDNLSKEKEEYCKKLTLEELRMLLLTQSSWHHTSKFFNETIFYCINEDKVEELTPELVEDIINSRIPKIKEKKIEKANLYITALVDFSVWTGTRKHLKKEDIREVVYFRSNDKLVSTSEGRKRLSSLNIVYKVEQKTRYATAEKVDKSRKLDIEREDKKMQTIKKLLNCKILSQSLSGNYYRLGEKPYSKEVKEGLERVSIIDNKPILQQYVCGEWIEKK